MAKFKAGEHEFTLSLTVGALKRVRDSLQYDLAKALSPLGMEDLLRDPVRFVDVLYVLVREQCEQRGVTDEQFGESLYGDALWEAIKAFEHS